MAVLLLILLRSLVMYFTVLITIRVLGKRTMAQLTPVDRVSGITFGTIAGAVTVNPHVALSIGVTAIVGFGFTSWFLGYLSVHFGSVRKLVVGEPHRVIHHGKLLSEALHKVGLTSEDIWVRLREAQIKTLTHVEDAYLEPDGRLGLTLYSSEAKGTSAPETPTT